MMFSQHVVHATPVTDGNHDEDNDEYDDDNDDDWKGHEEHAYFSDTDNDQHKEESFETEWKNNMTPTFQIFTVVGTMQFKHFFYIKIING